MNNNTNTNKNTNTNNNINNINFIDVNNMDWDTYAQIFIERAQKDSVPTDSL
jgi:hypothetical protein